ncbi:DUF1680-domain-containing protein [Coniochaeta sp. PMI_546]|nr:DUF1680-domain-containing protein [Coniochaeta sp. PMI_546]
MVDKKTYLTGGIGAIKQWEGFGIDYFLPQGTDEGGCYAATCASIGVIMLAERFLHLCDDNEPDRRYADTMELYLYNNVMTAMSVDGNEFTYVNQPASSDMDASAQSEWFEVICCPPNLPRLFGSLGGYLWGYGSIEDEAFVNVHLYTSATLTFNVNGHPVSLQQTSQWSWEGMLQRFVSAYHSGVKMSTPSETMFLGYRRFQTGYVTPHPYTNQGTSTLARGPIIYCAEDADNEWEENQFKDTAVSRTSTVTEESRLHQGTSEEDVA